MATRIPPGQCPHSNIHDEAIAGPGGIPLRALAAEQRDLDGMVATIYLGYCLDCEKRVVRVQSWEAGTTGRSWTSPASPLLRDALGGESR